MACHPTHNLAHMPVFNIGTAVIGQIGNILCKGPGRRMKAKGGGAQHLALFCFYLDIAVNGFGDAEDLDPGRFKMLCQEGGVGIGIIPANDHQCIKIQALADGQCQFHFAAGINFGPPGFNHVKTTHVPVGVHQFRGDLNVPVFKQPFRPFNKPEHL